MTTIELHLLGTVIVYLLAIQGPQNVTWPARTSNCNQTSKTHTLSILLFKTSMYHSPTLQVSKTVFVFMD